MVGVVICKLDALLTDINIDDLSGNTQPAQPTHCLATARRKSVQFALEPREESVEELDAQEFRGQRYDKSRYVPEPRRSHSADDATPVQHFGSRRNDYNPRRHLSPDSSASNVTIGLPPCFHGNGRGRGIRGEDRLAVAIEDLLKGKGVAGALFKRLTGLDNGRESMR